MTVPLWLALLGCSVSGALGACVVAFFLGGSRATRYRTHTGASNHDACGYFSDRKPQPAEKTDAQE